MAAEVEALGAEEDEAPDADPGASGRCRCPSPGVTSSAFGSSSSRSGACAKGPGSAPARRAMVGKSYFEEALRWLAIQGGEEERALAAQWSGLSPLDARSGRRCVPGAATGPGAPREGGRRHAPPPPPPSSSPALGAGRFGLTSHRTRSEDEPWPFSPRRRSSSSSPACPAGSAAGRRFAARGRSPDFSGSMAFVNRVAALAEAADHHPDIDIRYSKVTLVLSTHDAGGLTARDFALAEAIGA